jgi:hypothetical protein
MVLRCAPARRAYLLRRARDIKKLTPMMRRATKKPAPDRAANTGLTWAFWALVRSGNVDGGTGIWPPMGAMVVEVVVDVGAGVAGVVGAVPK